MALSKVFRFAVKGDNIVTVKEEMDYIREYATIIDYRFMGKIEVDYDIDEDLYQHHVIKLMLQPIVENAVFHGLEQKVDGGTVEVSVQNGAMTGCGSVLRMMDAECQKNGWKKSAVIWIKR